MFTCGQPNLDTWIDRFAYANQRADMTRVFVSTDDEEHVKGFYALSTGGVDTAQVPQRVAKGVPRHPVPVVILTRLAVHIECQGHGLGRALVRDALIRVATASHAVGVRALLVHAKDNSARAFYMALGEFEPSPTDPLHLFLLMKDLGAATGQLP